MLPSARFGFASLVVALVGSGCVFDAHGTRQDTTSTTGQGGSSTTSVGPGGTSTTSSTGSGMGGMGPVCGDGIVEAPETCETGNLSFASCVSCSITHTCGNNVVEPGEACDESSANCTSCQVTAGTCFMVNPLAMVLTPTQSTTVGAPVQLPGGFNDATPSCGSNQTRPVKVFRYEVGPYPSGLYVSATGDTSLDAVLWAYAGCTKGPIACNDIDPDPLGVPNNTAYLALPVAPPGSVFFVAVGDWGSQSGAFHFVAAPTRFFEDFENTFGQFTQTGSWFTSTHYVSVSNPAADATLESSDIDVVGITDLQISLAHSLSAGSNASVIVVPDGGAPTAQAQLTDTASVVAGRSVVVSIPPGTKSAKVRLRMSQGTGYWEIHRVIVGPKVP